MDTTYKIGFVGKTAVAAANTPKTMSRKLLFFALLVTAAVCGVHCLKPIIRSPNDDQTTGHYIAVLKETTSRERLLELVKLLNNTMEGCVVYGYVEVAVKAITMELSDGALRKVRNIPEVKYVEKEGLAYAAGSESVSGDRWFLDRLDQLTLPLDNSYEPLAGDGEGVDVYVLDTGINYRHQEFEYRAKYAGYDPVDQYEYTRGTRYYKPRGGADCNGHGTHVASLVGGKTYGTAREASLYSVRVLRCDTSAPWSIILDGLDFLATIIPKRSQNAIVVLALSGPFSNSVNDAIESLHRQDVVIIAAAGNSGVDACQRSPSSSPYAITVGSTDRNDNAAAHSNYGSCVDLFAPGQNISGASDQCDTCTAVMSGSTQAAGITAGVAASYFSQLPHLTPVQIKDKVLSQSVRGIVKFDVVPEEFQSNTTNTLLNPMCGGRISISSEPGKLQSPGYPGNYPSNLNCKWTLVAENNTEEVLLNFTYIKLEKNYDIITLCHGDHCSGQDNIFLTGDYGETDCGYVSVERSLTIMMDTDGSTQSPGFSAIYTAVGSDKEMEVDKCYTTDLSSVKTSVQLDIYSAGYNAGNRFSMKKDWFEFFAGRRRGINIVILDEVSGSILATESFDTYVSQVSSKKLAVAIEQIRPGRIVAAAVSDEAATNLNVRAKRALMSLGSDKINQIMYQGSWALIGTKGTACGRALEQLLSSAPVHLSAQVHLQPFHKYGLEVSVESAGLTVGNYATVKIDGATVNIPHFGYNRGLNVVILDHVSGRVLHKEVFDTSAEGIVNSPSDRFVSLVRSQWDGAIVIIAIKEEGVDYLSESAKRACESVGSSLIRQVGHGGSWAIVGRKGAPRGSVPEAASNSGPSEATFFLAPTSAGVTPCPVVLQSSSPSGVGASIAVNKTSRISPLSRGITVAVLGDNECAVETSQTFTSSQFNQLVDLIKLIPPGKVVLASVSGDGVQHMTDGGRAALEAIGSAIIRNIGYQQAWAIIGKKGAPRGSVLEQHHSYSTAIGTTTTLASVHTPHISIKSAGLNVGNYVKLVVNGEVLQIQPGLIRGLHVVVIDGTNYSVLHKQVFDTHYYSVASTRFVNLINSLPDGSVVAIAIKNEGTRHLSEAAKQAIERLGSKYIRQVAYRGSWAILGRKGAPRGTVLEAINNVGPTEIISHTLPTTQNNKSVCKIFVESAGCRDYGGLQLTINGVTSTLPGSRGIRIAVLEVDRCAVETVTVYDTYASVTASAQLASFLAAIPTGKIVVASIWDEGSHRLTEDAKLALESIGSALIRSVGYRDGWAVVGRKGASPGSVPESFMPSVTRAGSSSVAVGGLMELKSLLCNVLYPLTCLISGTE